MTIPYAGTCVGSGREPRQGTVDGSDPATGVCPACSGRFELVGDRLSEHETAPEDARVALDAS